MLDGDEDSQVFSADITFVKVYFDIRRFSLRFQGPTLIGARQVALPPANLC